MFCILQNINNNVTMPIHQLTIWQPYNITKLNFCDKSSSTTNWDHDEVRSRYKKTSVKSIWMSCNKPPKNREALREKLYKNVMTFANISNFFCRIFTYCFICCRIHLHWNILTWWANLILLSKREEWELPKILDCHLPGSDFETRWLMFY